MSIELSEIKVGLGQLMLDPNNYRLNNGSDDETYSSNEVVELQPKIEDSLVKENISDLESSIIENGFLEVDKIVVTELLGLNEKNATIKKYLVIEGNRRTAAFKSIINEYESLDSEGKKYFTMPEGLLEKSKSINVVLVCGDESSIVEYSHRLMGIRHVSGPRQWGGYQSARLIHDMSQDKDYKSISSLLGMRPGEAKRRHETYLALKQMQEDEKYKDKADIKYFTLISEFVASNKFCKEVWLGWDNDERIFKSKNRYRMYDAIIVDDDGVQELNNPSKVRKFIKCVGVEELRLAIESGDKLTDLDYYDWDSSKRLSRISDFTKFIKNCDDFKQEELKSLSELVAVIKRIMEAS
ncbi:hypothetical protein MA612_003553 [Vibrio parahaemolyticus]|nr:hypothetical protein [Vibrio parahaemolyticus]EIV8669642.1 hypothetical protein [Vibrio parahaemolyticus]